jgi:hypothetical protein
MYRVVQEESAELRGYINRMILNKKSSLNLDSVLKAEGAMAV